MDNLKLMMKLRDQVLKRFIQSKLASNWAYYKQLRNLTTNTVKAERKAYSL